MGAVSFLPVPFLAAVPVFTPHSRFVLWCGDSVDLGCPHPTPPVGLAQGARGAAWGVPPLPHLVQGIPPLSLLQSLREERVLLIRGVPPLLPPLAAHWGSALLGSYERGTSPPTRTTSTCDPFRVSPSLSPYSSFSSYSSASVYAPLPMTLWRS